MHALAVLGATSPFGQELLLVVVGAAAAAILGGMVTSSLNSWRDRRARERRATDEWRANVEQTLAKLRDDVAGVVAVLKLYHPELREPIDAPRRRRQPRP